MSVPRYRKVAAAALAAGLELSLAACSTKSDDSSDAGGRVTITVDCQPVGAQKELLKNWNDDVAEFQRQNPDIVVKSVSVGEQCNNPPDFTARLAGGTVTDVFYGYMTDLQQVLDSGQAMDIGQYATKDTIPTWDSVDPALKDVFTDGGKLYAVPVKNYSMGLIYNKALFQRAGLDVNNPPKTWPEVRGRGQEDLRARRWHRRVRRVQRRQHRRLALHLAALLPGRPGAPAPTARRPTSTTRWAGRSCRTSRTCAPGDNSMGARQLLQWGDLLTNAGAGKVGMFIGAPDATQAIVSQFQGKYQDWAMGPLPGQDGPAKATLGGGEGYFFKKGLSPDQVKAGLKWLAYQKLTRQGPVRLRARQAAELPGRPAPAAVVRRRQRRAEAGTGAAQGQRQRGHHELRGLRGQPGADQGGAAQRAGDLRGARRGDVRWAEPEREHRRAAQDRRGQGQPAAGRAELTRPEVGPAHRPHLLEHRRSRLGAHHRPGATRRPGPVAPPPSRTTGRRAGLGRKVRDNLTGHAFLIGAVVCFAVFLVPDGPRRRDELPAHLPGRDHLGAGTTTAGSSPIRASGPPGRTRSSSPAWRSCSATWAVLRGDPAQRAAPRQGLPAGARLPAGDAATGLSAVPVQVLRVRPERAGLFNAILTALGLPTSEWMQSPAMTMPAMVIASTWMNMGGAVLIYLAALQNIPGELYEAAEIDGAGVWRRIRHVTIPQTRLILALPAMLQIVATMQLFIEPLILANGAGTQDSATSVAYLIYQHGFFQNDLNGAAALGVIMLVVLAGFSAVYLRLTARQD
ncbi:extracellular solute-binding protein [Micromonospora sp. BRA006-A]|nr:extracellular solute-binding protein [Micromonospora sp. BRA006-A]